MAVCVLLHVHNNYHSLQCVGCSACEPNGMWCVIMYSVHVRLAV